MTKAQQRKLETLTGKLEALQNEVENFRIADLLGQGKRKLIDALREAEHASR